MKKGRRSYMENYIDGLMTIEDYNEEETCYVLDTNYFLHGMESVLEIDAYFETIMERKNNIFIPFIVWVEFNYNVKDKLKTIKKELDRTNKFLGTYEENSEKLEFKMGEITHKFVSMFDYNIIEGTLGKDVAINSKEFFKSLLDEKKEINDLIMTLNESTQQVFAKWLQNFQEKSKKEIEEHLSKTREWIIKFKEHVEKPELKSLIGKKYTREELEKLIGECKQREKDNLKPGNSQKDLEKDKFKVWDDLTIPSKYGDMLIWLELIEYAKNNSKYKKFVFVSDDVSKKDWVDPKSKELWNQLSIEFCTKTGVTVENMRTQELVKKFSSEKYLQSLQEDYIFKKGETTGISTEDDEMRVFHGFSEGEHEVIYKSNDIEVFEEGLNIIERLESEYEFRDTIVVPARSLGFAEVFLGEDCWYSVRISKDRIPYLKYIAVYQSYPKSAVTYVAKIDKIVPSPYETGKSMVIFDGCAKQLKRPIPLGENKLALQSPRYTNHRKLVSATTVDDLFDFSELDDLFY